MAMLNALTTFLNFDTTPGAPDWSWYDALAGLESGEVDVLVGQYSYTDWRYDSYSTLGPHGVSNYRWYLPVPLPSFLPIVPHLALPTVVVASTVLGLVAAVAVLAFASDRTGNSVLHVWSMFVEQPIPQTGLDGIQLASRVVILSSLVGFVNVNVLIKSTIVTSMSRPSVFSGLQSTEELAGLSKVVIGMDTPLISTLLNISTVPSERALANRSEECYLNFTDCVHRLQAWALSGDDTMFVLVCGEEMLEFATAGAAKFTIYSLKEPLHHNIYGWYGRKKFPMADRANRLFLLLQQSGLQALWAKMLSTNISAVNQFSRSPFLNNAPQAIPFLRARNLFVMLVLGEAVAFVVFLLEHVADRCALRGKAGKTRAEGKDASNERWDP
ncbi:uncharacterized protein LOC117643286 [Thrips palmi]|uniref:Uncharacterized protein LOC117643286 n=1 Tax=Thrips palmi TaxID=161013 RepID=A0A6P8YLN6_THRPL|nr:uncharacterized protein LOC117643286 [Thrips palmi]